MNWSALKDNLSSISADIRRRLSRYIPDLSNESDDITRISVAAERERERLKTLIAKRDALRDLNDIRQQVREIRREIDGIQKPSEAPAPGNPSLTNRKAPISKS